MASSGSSSSCSGLGGGAGAWSPIYGFSTLPKGFVESAISGGSSGSSLPVISLVSNSVGVGRKSGTLGASSGASPCAIFCPPTPL